MLLLYSVQIQAIINKNFSNNHFFYVFSPKFVLKTLHTFTRLKYQRRNSPHVWHTLHVSLPLATYEQCCDIRKFFKRSVSRFIAKAINQYLDILEQEIIQKTKKRKYTDNYLKNYIVISQKEADISSFTVFWGIPVKKELQKHIE